MAAQKNRIVEEDEVTCDWVGTNEEQRQFAATMQWQ